jgi:hypothetical protein
MVLIYLKIKNVVLAQITMDQLALLIKCHHCRNNLKTVHSSFVRFEGIAANTFLKDSP